MHNSIGSGRPVTASITAQYTGLLKSTIKRKAGEIKMKAVVKMEITLHDSKGNAVVHDVCERVYETVTVPDYSGFSRYNKHIEELNFGWKAIVENDFN